MLKTYQPQCASEVAGSRRYGKMNSRIRLREKRHDKTAEQIVA